MRDYSKESIKNLLTTEEIKRNFKSNFELAQHAILRARFYIKSGKEVTLEQVLEEVRSHPELDNVESDSERE